MDGTRPSSSKLPTTCSRCAGATTRGFAGLRAIGCGSACSIRDHRLANNQSRSRRNAKALPPRLNPRCPTDWQDIDVNKLVLAKEDGPPRSWWEAIPVEKAGETFKLRWRDYSTMPPISRDRFALALICPDAA